jgi:hypothetical protein
VDVREYKNYRYYTRYLNCIAQSGILTCKTQYEEIRQKSGLERSRIFSSSAEVRECESDIIDTVSYRLELIYDQ